MQPSLEPRFGVNAFVCFSLQKNCSLKPLKLLYDKKFSNC